MIRRLLFILAFALGLVLIVPIAVLEAVFLVPFYIVTGRGYDAGFLVYGALTRIQNWAEDV